MNTITLGTIDMKRLTGLLDIVKRRGKVVFLANIFFFHYLGKCWQLESAFS